MGFWGVTATDCNIYKEGSFNIFGSDFYHGTIRKYVALFGSLFNDITIDRVDANNNVTDSIKVPVSYGPKDRYLARLKQNPDLLREINLVLPRISFEIKSIEYDASRKLNTIGQNRAVQSNTSGNFVASAYNPVPYNLNIELSILTRNADDAMRIVEQILPFFKPEWTTAITLIPELGIIENVPIVLKEINYQDTYDDTFESKYAIIWSLGFILKGTFYGPVSSAGVIKEVIVNFYVPTTNTAAEGVGITSTAEYFTITPGLDANGNPTSNASISIPVANIAANSNYGFITDFFSNVG